MHKFSVQNERRIRFFKDGEQLDDQTLPDWMTTQEMRQAMTTLSQFSEKEINYHAYQARQNFLRQQSCMERDRQETHEALLLAEQKLAMALQNVEIAQQEKDIARQNMETAQQEKEIAQQEKAIALQNIAIALQEKDMVRQKMEAALAELERLKAQLGKQDPTN